MTVHELDATTWTVVARLDALRIDRGVAALVAGEPVAVFRLGGEVLAAVDHVEPFTGVPVLARGLVGSTGDVTYVASPLHKQRFDLATGRCLEDASVSVRVWPVELIDGFVCIAAPPNSPARPGALVPDPSAPG